MKHRDHRSCRYKNDHRVIWFNFLDSSWNQLHVGLYLWPVRFFCLKNLIPKFQFATKLGTSTVNAIRPGLVRYSLNEVLKHLIQVFAMNSAPGLNVWAAATVGWAYQVTASKDATACSRPRHRSRIRILQIFFILIISRILLIFFTLKKNRKKFVILHIIDVDVLECNVHL